MTPSFLKFLGFLLSLTGAIFTGYAILGFPESDRYYTKMLLSLILIAAGLVVLGMGEILLALKRLAATAERPADPALANPVPSQTS